MREISRNTFYRNMVGSRTMYSPQLDPIEGIDTPVRTRRLFRLLIIILLAVACVVVGFGYGVTR